MKEIIIGTRVKYIALVDDEDYERVSLLNWTGHPNKRKDGTMVVYARHRSKKYGKLFMHHFVLKTSSDALWCKDKLVDHDDHNGLNNQKQNLKVSSAKHNGRNRRKKAKGFGIYYRQGKYILVFFKKTYTGTLYAGAFNSKEEAMRHLEKILPPS